jgi:hypothetical protein
MIADFFQTVSRSNEVGAEESGGCPSHAGADLIAEVEDASLADQAEAGETNANAAVSLQDAPVSRGGEGRGSAAPERRSPTLADRIRIGAK